MCGIFAHVKNGNDDGVMLETLRESMMQIQHRGPDNSQELLLNESAVYIGFHRLSLVGRDPSNNMPLLVDRCVLVCNGMIYNYKTLIEQNDFRVKTENDCEVIIHMYKKYGLPLTLEKLEGVFAFILYDHDSKTLMAGNDAIGIRPLFYGINRAGSYTLASEPVALAKICDARIVHFTPGHYMTVGARGVKVEIRRWWNPTRTLFPLATDNGDQYGRTMFALLKRAVHKRLLGERPVACLLSGGLDSSIVAALVAERLREVNPTQPLHTFSIGLADAPDLIAARKVANHIRSFHHEIVVTEAEMLEHQNEIVRITQSPDVTTNRASTPMSLLCRHIARHFDFKIIFNGDCSEEIWASYAYSKRAPSDEAFHEDNWRLVEEVYLYDVLRSDRCIAHYGMDARTPFADRQLVEYVMRIPPQYKRHGGQYGLEKTMLRQYAKDYLPADIAWRPKEAFSDGVSVPQRSWHTIIRDYYDALIDTHNPQFQRWARRAEIDTKEAYWYWTHFVALFCDGGETREDIRRLVPRYWMPRFVENARDPSARTLPPH